MKCPKCGEVCYQYKVTRLSALPFEYHGCSSPICNWDNEAEQRKAVKSEYPELFKPINWAERGIEWKRFDGGEE